MDEILRVPLTRLHMSTILLRCVDTDSLDYLQLEESVAEHGVLQSLLVRPSRKCAGDYEIIEGSYRFTAAARTAQEDVPCIVRDMDDDTVRALQLQLNMLRPEMKPIEISNRLRRILVDHPDMDMAELSQHIKRSAHWISRYLSFQRLHNDIAEQVNRGHIPLESGALLSKLPHAIQKTLIEDAVALPVRKFKPLIQDVIRKQRAGSSLDRFQRLYEEPFQPIPHLRPVREIARQIQNPGDLAVMLTKHPVESELEAALLALRWVIHLDPDSAERQREAARKRGQEIADSV